MRTNTKKPRTARKIKSIIERHRLTDLALAANRPWHTWFRPSNQGQSSRIDLILASSTHDNLQVHTTLLTFDHVFLEATFNVVRTTGKRAMKDFILGSEEYLIQAQEIYEEHMEQFQRDEEAYQPDDLLPAEDVNPTTHTPDNSISAVVK